MPAEQTSAPQKATDIFKSGGSSGFGAKSSGGAQQSAGAKKKSTQGLSVNQGTLNFAFAKKTKWFKEKKKSGWTIQKALILRSRKESNWTLR